MQKQSKQSACRPLKNQSFVRSPLYRPDSLRSAATVRPCFAWLLDPFTDAELMALCGISKKTCQRWRRGVQTIHPGHRALLELHRDGRVLPASWQGAYRFRFIGEALQWDDHRSGQMTAADVAGWPMKLQHLQTLQVEIDRYRQQLTAARERVGALEAMLPKAPVLALSPTAQGSK